ncbi:VWA domain-containing protein [Paenibacillus sp. WQ 127069]|uniref:VWA domain-containing protein n=1 Tax=Paenibacillus baimaensis TaxID=2982185 RepID=A0ABT2UNQ5_9BACL|nr:vWA domain-containing protein [Paenibacillus sp. WQ 127069]MCU6796283.1 VWA domain-containing protein [Paenibacillus sp. WQ 127069]
MRKWNGLLTLFSLISGIIGFVIGEYILDRWDGTIHETLLMGLYFGQFALVVGLGCLLAEIISPQLNGKNWRLRYANEGWKFLVPATLVLLFAAGALFQWGYGLQLGNNDKPQDYVLLIDMSESMKTSDPQKQSIQAAQALINKMDDGKQVAVFTFNEQTQLIAPLTKLKDPAARAQLTAKLSAIGAPIGQTDIGRALDTAMEHLTKERIANRKAAVILISDGYSDMNEFKVLTPYEQQRTQIHTVGIDSTQVEGNQLLQRIAAQTNGTFHDVKRVEGVANAFDQIYQNGQRWHLVNERAGTAADGYHGWLRILLILLIGALLGLALGIVFDNRFLAKCFAIGGALGGLIAGVILETGLQGSVEPFIVRAFADVALALVLSLSTVLIAVGGPGGSGTGRNGFRKTALEQPIRGERQGRETIRKQFR